MTDRYLMDFDSEKIEREHHDVLIIGSGIAGVFTSLKIPEHIDVAIITKETIEISNSVLAQGGIAVSLDKGDSPELHFKDTLYAGAGLCDEEAVWVLVNEAAGNIDYLCKFGVEFDMKSPGKLSFTREGAHSMNRIIHAGDTTGKEVLDKLITEVRTRKNILIKESTTAVDLLTENNVCKGLLTFDEKTGKKKIYMSDFIICATGGFGQIYKNTTNPEVATGDGVCMAYRAGAELMDLEFIQFHPTVLFHPENKNFLISEAIRGEGAKLLNIHKERFMAKYHELEELAPRDVVSRAIFQEMLYTGSEYVYLDISFMDREYLESRFPNIFKTCLSYGIDISQDLIPVAPAEHYCMGGIKTDVFGRTNIKGFYACGEAACNGIHGANRLASNSLLEGLVFGNKISIEVTNYLDNIENKNTGNFKNICNKKNIIEKAENMKYELQKNMNEYVGIVRDSKGLQIAKENALLSLKQLEDAKIKDLTGIELSNMELLSILVIESALNREESRGAHFRSDFNKLDDENWKKNIIVKRGPTNE